MSHQSPNPKLYPSLNQFYAPSPTGSGRVLPNPHNIGHRSDQVGGLGARPGLTFEILRHLGHFTFP